MIIKFKIFSAIITLIAISYCSLTYCQISSGQYSFGLNLAFNPETNIITGYFENYSRLEENTTEPRLSCIFYITGKYDKNVFNINTYSHLTKKGDLIKGKIQIKDSTTISIILNEVHKGCWNVQPFSDESVDFSLTTKQKWIEINYIDMDKAYFYNDKNENSKKKSFVIKGNIVYIDQIENNWIHCQYRDKIITEGWLKRQSIND
ncbi:MAG: hypothetical protein A2046_08415 [Bacteroidetes bacterium GWA2_30_7]|nr:MAG: hypothetical protein A2046_08415 [Bacteroidetes bacterium GWA2_30_7]